MKWFKRFRDIRPDDSTWNIGRGKWDAITVIPKRNMKVCGIGIFEVKPQANFSMGWKYVI